MLANLLNPTSSGRLRLAFPLQPAMSTAPSGSRSRAATLLFLVAIIVFVPPLVRATALIVPNTPSPHRLNRGFDAPPKKCTIAPPADLVFQCVPQLRVSMRVERFSAPATDPLPDLLLGPSPDTLRGPPRPALS